MKTKETTEVIVDGILEEREIDFIARRDVDRWVEYPVLKAGEHFYENNKGIIVFSSSFNKTKEYN